MNWLISLLGGGLAEQLRRAYESKLQAQNDESRLAADVRIKMIETRLAQPSNRMLQFAIGLAALGVCGHVFFVSFVSVFPFWGWTVHALPSPMNEWQREIVLGLFGLGGLSLMLRR
jgi:hypothetical protein